MSFGVTESTSRLVARMASLFALSRDIRDMSFSRYTSGATHANLVRASTAVSSVLDMHQVEVRLQELPIVRAACSLLYLSEHTVWISPRYDSASLTLRADRNVHFAIKIALP